MYTGSRVMVRSKLRLQPGLRNLEWTPITLRWQEFVPYHVALTTNHEHKTKAIASFSGPVWKGKTMQKGLKLGALFSVGIDVAATTVTVTWQAGNQPVPAPRTFAQTATGLSTLIEYLQRNGVDRAHTLVVMEATGSYWVTVATVLTNRVCCECRQCRSRSSFRQVPWTVGENGCRRCGMLVRLAQERQPSPWTPPAPVYHELRQRLVARDGLIGMRTQARNQRHALQQWPVVIESVLTQMDLVIATLTFQISQLEQRLLTSWRIVRGHPRLPCSEYPGVGMLTAPLLLVMTVNLP